MTKENTVISILFINGMELVGRFVSETTEDLVVYKPRMAQMSQQDGTNVSARCGVDSFHNCNGQRN